MNFSYARCCTYVGTLSSSKAIITDSQVSQHTNVFCVHRRKKLRGNRNKVRIRHKEKERKGQREKNRKKEKSKRWRDTERERESARVCWVYVRAQNREASDLRMSHRFKCTHHITHANSHRWMRYPS